MGEWKNKSEKRKKRLGKLTEKEDKIDRKLKAYEEKTEANIEVRRELEKTK